MLHQFVGKVLPVVMRQTEKVTEEVTDDAETNREFTDRKRVFRDAVVDQLHDLVKNKVEGRLHIVFFCLELRSDIGLHISVGEHMRIQRDVQIAANLLKDMVSDDSMGRYKQNSISFNNMRYRAPDPFPRINPDKQESIWCPVSKK